MAMEVLSCAGKGVKGLEPTGQGACIAKIASHALRWHYPDQVTGVFLSQTINVWPDTPGDAPIIR
jgi:hypothetical protein